MRLAMLKRRARMLAQHPDVTTARALAPLMGDHERAYWAWIVDNARRETAEDRAAGPHRCLPHGFAACWRCARNPDPCVDTTTPGCDFYEVSGMHRYDCIHRVRETPRCNLATGEHVTPHVGCILR